MLRIGTPCSLRPSLNRLMPPNSTVPPSGTLTVVVTVTKLNVGNCTVVPSVVTVLPAELLDVSVPPVELALVEVVVVEPVNVKFLHVADTG